MFTLDFALMQRHLTLIDPAADRFLFCSYDDNSLGTQPPEQVFGSLADPAVRSWMESRQARGCHLGVVVNTMAGARRRARDFTAARALFAEMDQAPLKPFPITPNWVVNTSPGRHHYYWRFTTPVDRETFGALARRLVADYGADAGSNDTTRVLRIAGSWHLKDTPRLVTLQVLRGGSHTAAELAQGFPPLPKPPRVQTAALDPVARDLELQKLEQALPFVGMPTREDWLRVGMALNDGLDGDTRALEIWKRFSWTDEITQDDCECRWDTFEPGGGVGIATVYGMAYRAGFKGFTGDVAFGGPSTATVADMPLWCAEPNVMSAGAGVPAIAGASPGVARVITHTAFAPRPSADIPRRQFLYGTRYIRGEASGLFAPGGTGKSALADVEMIAILTGLRLLYEDPRPPLRVIHFGEDRRDELERRKAAIAEHYGIDWATQIGDRLILHSLRDEPLCLFGAGYVVNHADVEALKALIRAHRADVVYFDTMKKIHKANENDNGEMDALISLLNAIAQECNCSIVILGHTRKINDRDSVSVGNVRGASSTIDTLRVANIVTRMTKEEATTMGIDEKDARSYVRIADSKENMAPFSPHAEWYRLKNHELGNGGFGVDGDHVQVIVAYRPKIEIVDELSEDTTARILDAVDASACYEGIMSHQWVGYTIARAMGIDVGVGGDTKGYAVERRKIRKIAEKLIRSGQLVAVSGREGRNRNLVNHVYTKRMNDRVKLSNNA